MLQQACQDPNPSFASISDYFVFRFRFQHENYYSLTMLDYDSRCYLHFHYARHSNRPCAQGHRDASLTSLVNRSMDQAASEGADDAFADLVGMLVGSSPWDSHHMVGKSEDSKVRSVVALVALEGQVADVSGTVGSTNGGSGWREEVVGLDEIGLGATEASHTVGKKLVEVVFVAGDRLDHYSQD